MQLYTIVIGTADESLFLAWLATAGIAQVVDVRRFPGSLRATAAGRRVGASTI